MSQAGPLAAALKTAWIESETRCAEIVSAQWESLVLPVGRPRKPVMSAAYYQELHETNEAYQENNWLVASLPDVIAHAPCTITELGCGNGRFAAAAAPHVEKVYALDWARSAEIAQLPGNVEFIRQDVLTAPVPPSDIVCSADFLEHFSPEDLPSLVEKLLQASARQFHLIACYDDSHSHLTVMPPSGWLSLFLQFTAKARIRDLQCRRDDPRQVVCTIEAD